MHKCTGGLQGKIILGFNVYMQVTIYFKTSKPQQNNVAMETRTTVKSKDKTSYIMKYVANW